MSDKSYDTDWSVRATEAALDAFDRTSFLDLERHKGPELAMWHLLVGMQELCARKGINFETLQSEASEGFREMVDNGSISLPGSTALGR